MMRGLFPRGLLPASRGGMGLAPGIPTGLNAAPLSRSVALTWDPTPGATSYLVRRGPAPGGPYGTTAGTPATNSFTDTGLTNGTPYYYVVAAVNGAGTSGDSAEATATPTFSPTGLTGLLVWFSSGTKYQDTGTATPCAATNDPVGNWPDASGNNRHATQATDLSRPQYKPAAKNGLAAVNFGLDRLGNSANSNLRTPLVAHGIGTGDFWWISVIRAGAAVANRSICSNGGFAPVFYNQAGKLSLYTVGTWDTTLTVGAWYVVECWRSAGTARAAINGVVEPSTFSYPGAMGDAVWAVGNDPSGESYNDHIAEQLAYKRTPTLSDRQDLVSFLGSKWNITVTP